MRKTKKIFFISIVLYIFFIPSALSCEREGVCIYPQDLPFGASLDDIIASLEAKEIDYSLNDALFKDGHELCVSAEILEYYSRCAIAYFDINDRLISVSADLFEDYTFSEIYSQLSSALGPADRVAQSYTEIASNRERTQVEYWFPVYALWVESGIAYELTVTTYIYSYLQDQRIEIDSYTTMANISIYGPESAAEIIESYY